MQTEASTTPSNEEISHRLNKLISTAEDQVGLRHNWTSFMEENSFTQLPQEDRRKIALNAACGMLGIEKSEANHSLSAVCELAAILQGSISDLEQNRRRGRISFYLLIAFICFLLALACFKVGLPIVGFFCLLMAAGMLWIVHALRQGKPIWVTDLFQDYFP